MARAVLAAGLSMAALGAPATAHDYGQRGCPLPTFGPGASYHPTTRPADFSAHITNPYFPLNPGTTYVSAGTKDGRKAVDVFAVSGRTKVIDGVRTRLVNDRNYLNGVLEERTTDYYAQDRCGNVWYFGEDTAALDTHGNVVDTDGSFHAGVGGAQPGVYMQARPTWPICGTRSIARSGGRRWEPSGEWGIASVTNWLARLPISARLTAAFAAVMALLLVAIGVIACVSMANALLDEIDAGLRFRAGATVAASAAGTVEEPNPALRNPARRSRSWLPGAGGC